MCAALFLALVTLMTAMSTAAPVAAQDDPPAGDSSIEVHVAACEPGYDPNDLFNDCHGNGIADVQVRLTSADGALDQAKATVQPSASGPGVAQFSGFTGGSYMIDLDLPAQGADIFTYCSLAESDEVVPITPENRPRGLVTVSDGEAVICDFYILPAAQVPAQIQQPEQPDDQASITIDTLSCPEGTDPTSGFDELLAECTEPLDDVAFTWEPFGGESETFTPEAGDVVIAGIEEGSYRLWSDVPLTDVDEAVNTEILFCVADEGNRYQKELSDSGVTTFDPIKREQIECHWFVLPLQAEATAPLALTESLQQAGQARITVNPAICPAGTEAPSGFGDLDGVCTDPAENVTFTWGNAAGTIETFNTDNADPIVIDGIEEGTYTLYSDVPLEFASEVLFCVADGGNRYQKEFSENGVTTFGGIVREQIVCDWFILPFDLRDGNEPTPTTEAGPAGNPVVTPTPGPATTEPTTTPATGGDARGVETGGSLVVHLGLCPMDYSGDQLFDTCHGVGVSDQPFTLTGPNGEAEQITTVPQTPGPGIAQFMSLPAGIYTLAGGPPGDFGSVQLYCTTQPGGNRIDATLDSTRATFTIGEGEDILCDWYYIAENQGGDTPTPTPTSASEPRAEILVTLYQCAPGTTVAGASYADLQNACDDTRDGVPFTIGDAGAPPLTANSGVSGPGAVRFYELLPADYTMSPTLPANVSSVAVFCQLNGGDLYQKTLSDGATTFVNVDGDSISCDWYALQSNPSANPEPDGPSGSITVREYLCGEDQSAITEWEQECDAGSTGATYTLASTTGAITLSAPTDADGVTVFSALPDGFYTLEQSEGIWCKARAERVDSQSRVIVEDGQNTDVFLYQCTDVTQLPSTGTGPSISPMDDDGWWRAVSPTQLALMGAGILGGVMLLSWSVTRRRSSR